MSTEAHGPTVHCIELNDIGIEVSDGTGTDLGPASPGFALLRPQGILTGTDARAQARLHPRQTHTRFWQRLGLEPLATPISGARHHADIAYTQLQQLQTPGNLEQVLFAVPGSFNSEQLGVLLGIVGQCSFRASGLVDAAVAAASSAAGRGQAVFLDIQLHQAVVTHLQIDESVVREQVEVIAGAGLLQLYDAWARLISEAFIRQCRFDPRHDAHTEQKLYDRLEDWLNGFARQGEQLLQLELGGISHQAKLEVDAVIAAAEGIYSQWRQRLVDSGAALRLLSHRPGALPGFAASLGECQVLDAGAVSRACIANRSLIESDGESLRFITRLPHQGAAQSTSQAARPAAAAEPTTAAVTTAVEAPAAPGPTHLLSGYEALAIPVSGLYLQADTGTTAGLKIFSGAPPGGHSARLWQDTDACRLDVPAGLKLQVNGRVPGESTVLACGDRIAASGSSVLHLIRVVGDGA